MTTGITGTEGATIRIPHSHSGSYHTVGHKSRRTDRGNDIEPFARKFTQEREERENTPLPFVVGMKRQQYVFDSGLQSQRPYYAGNGPQHIVCVKMRIDSHNRFHDIKRRCAYVAEHDADGDEKPGKCKPVMDSRSAVHKGNRFPFQPLEL